MKIYLATDHAGFTFKEKIKAFLQEKGYDVEDCGAFSYDKDDDYPDFIAVAAQKVAEDVSLNQESMGIIFGGSGQGEQMVANKYKGVRCALFYTPAVPAEAVDISGKASRDPFEIIKLTREHNHANILSLGVRFLTEEDMFAAVKVFLETPVSLEERHIRRVEKIKQIEGIQ